MKIFLDTDVILDFLYERNPFFHEARILVSQIEKKCFNAYISSLIIWNLFYILRKYFGRVKARQVLKEFRSLINIISIDEEIIDLALSSGMKDLEDAIQYHAAEKSSVDVIITRNIKDFSLSAIPVMTPKEFFNLV